MLYSLGMKLISSSLNCPSCQQALQPKVLGCRDCGIQVEGPFELNEFASLNAADLHFLRIFVHCEGRIREMETSLGLSYPTIRTRLAALKTRLASSVSSAGIQQARREPVGDSPESDQNALILEKLKSGEISFDAAMTILKNPSPKRSKT
jgi:hypothetical protein